MTENTFFMYLEKNNNKAFGQKSFSLFNGIWRRPIEHTKTFFRLMFYYFFNKVHYGTCLVKCRIFWKIARFCSPGLAYNVLIRSFLALIVQNVDVSKIFGHLISLSHRCLQSSPAGYTKNYILAKKKNSAKRPSRLFGYCLGCEVRESEQGGMRRHMKNHMAPGSEGAAELSSYLPTQHYPGCLLKVLIIFS